MISNFIFVLFVIFSIIIKIKKLCVNCKDNIPQDIFQIIFVSTLLFLFVGSFNVIKTILIIFFSYIVKILIFNVPKIVVNKCNFCKNPWNSNK